MKSSPDGLRPECIACRTRYPNRRPKRKGRIKDWRRDYRNTIRGFLADSLCNSLRSRHKLKHGTKTDLHIDHLLSLWEKQEGRCYWTGIELEFGDRLPDRHPLKLSFDKLDGSKGYVPGNIVLSSSFANRARGDCEPKEFRRVLAVIVASLARPPARTRR